MDYLPSLVSMLLQTEPPLSTLWKTVLEKMHKVYREKSAMETWTRNFTKIKTLLHYDTITLWHYYTMTLLHYDTITLWHYYTMTLLHSDTITLWHYYTVTLWHYYTMALLHYDTITLLHYYRHYFVNLRQLFKSNLSAEHRWRTSSVRL